MGLARNWCAGSLDPAKAAKIESYAAQYSLAFIIIARISYHNRANFIYTKTTKIIYGLVVQLQELMSLDCLK